MPIKDAAAARRMRCFVMNLWQRFEMQSASSSSAMSLIGICCVGRSEAGGCDLQREVVV